MIVIHRRVCTALALCFLGTSPAAAQKLGISLGVGQADQTVSSRGPSTYQFPARNVFDFGLTARRGLFRAVDLQLELWYRSKGHRYQTVTYLEVPAIVRMHLARDAWWAPVIGSGIAPALRVRCDGGGPDCQDTTGLSPTLLRAPKSDLGWVVTAGLEQRCGWRFLCSLEARHMRGLRNLSASDAFRRVNRTMSIVASVMFEPNPISWTPDSP